MAERAVCLCIPADLIRKQVIKNGTDIKCEKEIHTESWSRYPCKVLKKCRADHCHGRVSFSIAAGPKNVKIITLFFIREDQGSYAFMNRTLRSLFEEGHLKKVPYVTKELQIPVITEPTERADPRSHR